MIHYIFALNINSNVTLIDTPKSLKSTYNKPIKQALKKIQPASLSEEYRGKKLLKKSEYFIYQKLDQTLMVGAVTSDVKKDSEIYRFFTDIHMQIKQLKSPLKGNKEIEKWLKSEITLFNKGERLSASQRINKRLESANKKVEERITKEVQKFDDLEGLEGEILEMESMTQEMQSNAGELHREAYIMNKKLEILIWGGVGLLGIMVGIWLLEVVL